MLRITVMWSAAGLRAIWGEGRTQITSQHNEI